ncbi:cation:dicarboxylate symporter family transporter [Endozoicomonas sp. ALB091]|uniref:cation:dicarboxylate symporter family transporter n=1 Tax=Endozoicomonas sp. ALB091 TaxID=3403073 RepID=UPI003BB64C9B
MSLAVLTNIFIMVALLYLLYRFQKHCLPFTWRVFIALGMGVGYGACLQLFYGYPSETLTESINWFNIVGNGYVSLLKMIIVPLVMVSVISAILKLKGAGTLGSISGWILTLLMVTVSIADGHRVYCWCHWYYVRPGLWFECRVHYLRCS